MTNHQVSKVFRAFPKRLRGEIINKYVEALESNRTTFTEHIVGEDFTVDERVVLDDIMKPYIEIMPRVLDVLKEEVQLTEN